MSSMAFTIVSSIGPAKSLRFFTAFEKLAIFCGVCNLAIDATYIGDCMCASSGASRSSLSSSVSVRSLSKLLCCLSVGESPGICSCTSGVPVFICPFADAVFLLRRFGPVNTSDGSSSLNAVAFLMNLNDGRSASEISSKQRLNAMTSSTVGDGKSWDNRFSRSVETCKRLESAVVSLDERGTTKDRFLSMALHTLDKRKLACCLRPDNFARGPPGAVFQPPRLQYAYTFELHRFLIPALKNRIIALMSSSLMSDC